MNFWFLDIHDILDIYIFYFFITVLLFKAINCKILKCIHGYNKNAYIFEC